MKAILVSLVLLMFVSVTPVCAMAHELDAQIVSVSVDQQVDPIGNLSYLKYDVSSTHKFQAQGTSVKFNVPPVETAIFGIGNGKGSRMGVSHKMSFQRYQGKLMFKGFKERKFLWFRI